MLNYLCQLMPFFFLGAFGTAYAPEEKGLVILIWALLFGVCMVVHDEAVKRKP